MQVYFSIHYSIGYYCSTNMPFKTLGPLIIVGCHVQNKRGLRASSNE